MIVPKLFSPTFSLGSRRVLMGLIVAVIFETGVVAYAQFHSANETFASFVVYGGSIAFLLYVGFALVYAFVVKRWIQRVWKWIFAPRVDPFDLRWLRWCVTLGPAGVVFISWAAPQFLMYSIAVFGVVMSLYFAHLLFFRLQCSLLELLAITSVFGLVDGLVITTPGATKLGLYFSPMIAAWVLDGATTGLVNARLLDPERTKSALPDIASAWLRSASSASVMLGLVILLLARFAKIGINDFVVWGWPLLIIGLCGVVFEARIIGKVRTVAKSIVTPPIAPADVPALQTSSPDAKPMTDV